MTTQNKPQPKFKMWDNVKVITDNPLFKSTFVITSIFFDLGVCEHRYSHGSGDGHLRESDLELVEEQKEEAKKIKAYAYKGRGDKLLYKATETGGIAFNGCRMFIRSPDHDIYY